MKNKIVILILAFLLAITCTFNLAACDNSDNGANNGANNNGDNGNNDSQVIVTEVTAEQWLQALTELPNTTNYTYTTYQYFIQRDGNKIQIKMDEDGEIVSKESDGYFAYQQSVDNDEWTKLRMPAQWYNQYVSDCSGMILDITTVFKEEFDSLTYSDGKYICTTMETDGDFGHLKDIEIIFKNGAIVSLNFTSVQNDKDYSYALTDVGTTSVALPTVTDSSKTTKMTVEEWQQCCDRFSNAAISAAINMSLSVSTNGGELFVIKVDEDKYYDNSNGEQRIFIRNESYRFDKTNADSQWVKSDAVEGIWNTAFRNAYSAVLRVLSGILNNYSQVAFNNGKYTAELLKITDSEFLKNVEVTVSYYGITGIVCTFVGVGEQPDQLVTVSNIGTTQVLLPSNYIDNASTVFCPIKQNATIEIPARTPVEWLFQQYPELVTDNGTWELYTFDGIKDDWVKLTLSDKVPGTGEFSCKLVFNGEGKGKDVYFTIVGVPNSSSEQ